MPPLRVPGPIIAATQQFLRKQGEEPPCGHEGVVLWVGAAASGRVDEMLIPQQRTTRRSFDVPLPERQQIARSMVGTGRAVLAQVHSHPEHAWHSPIDDQRAMPRGVGSLSLVVPEYGRRPSLFDDAALYVLESGGTWASTSIATLVEDPDER